MNEQDIIYENGHAWVYRDRKRDLYTVYISGVTHSTSDSSYQRTPDGMTLAIARANHLARPK